MKIDICRDELLSALKVLAKVAIKPTGYQPPSLACVLLDCDSPAGLTIAATDLTAYVTIPIHNATRYGTGQLLLDARTLLDVAKSADKHGTITIQGSYDDGPVSVGPVKLESRDPGDFPMSPEAADGFSCQIGAEQFSRAVKALLPAASRDDSRAQLQGVIFDSNTDSLVTSDGKQIAIFTMADVAIPGILPMSAMSHAMRMANLDSGVVTVYINRDRMRARIELPYGTVDCRMIEGQLPDYLRLIPTDDGARAALPVKTLISAIKTASAGLEKDDQRVHFAIENGNLALNSASLAGPIHPTTSDRGFTGSDDGHYSRRFLLKILAGQDKKGTVVVKIYSGKRGLICLQSLDCAWSWYAMPIVWQAKP